MADSTLTKLQELVTEHSAKDVRQAALKILGHVGNGKDKNLARLVLSKLVDPDPELRVAAVEAVGLLRLDEALPQLEQFARKGGPELEASVHAASQLGTRGARLMGKVMHEVLPNFRSRIAAVMAKAGTGNALVITAQGLVDKDTKVVDATARSLAAEVPSYSSVQKNALAKFILDSLEDKHGDLTTKSQEALLRVLGTLHDERADEVYWNRLAPIQPPEVRIASLHGLNGSNPPSTENRLQKLLVCAMDKDFQIVASALMILKSLPSSAKTVKHWLKLIDAPDLATKRFALEKLQTIESAEAASMLVAQWKHANRDFREQCLNRLRAFDHGRRAVLGKLLEAESSDDAWNLSRALSPVAKEIPSELRVNLFEQASKHHDKDDSRAKSMWFLLREMDHAWSRDQIEAKAQALRKKKNYEGAIGYYRLLAQDPACSEEIRFELAATGLKESAHNLEFDHRSADPTLNQFARLMQNSAFDLVGHLKKAKWLDVEDLFYLGFHFAEQAHRAKEFGKHVLELVIERSPTSETGKQAKRKLKSEALS